MNNPDDDFVPSDDFELAEYIQDKARGLVKGLEWMTRQRSSLMAWERFNSIRSFLHSLRDELEPKHMLEVKDKELDDIIKYLDEASLDYDGEEDCQQYFGYYIRDYARVLTGAIAKGFTEEEKYQWEARS